MKAMVLVGQGRLELQEIPRPALEADSVLVKVEAAVICNTTDLRVIDAEDPAKVWPGQPWPVVLGHELCGRIVEVGERVKGWVVGDRIGGWGTPYGGFAEYCLVWPDRMAAVKIPAGIPSDAAALLEPAIGTMRYLMPAGVMAVAKRAEHALVTGLGPSGLLYVRECKLLGIPHVFASDPHEPRRALAREFGAEVVFSPADEPFKRLADRGIRIDVAIDTTGRDIVEDVLGILKPRGAVIPFGVGWDWAALKADLVARGIRLAEPELRDGRAAAQIVKDWVISGKLHLERIITRRIQLHEIPDALGALRRREQLKVVVII